MVLKNPSRVLLSSLRHLTFYAGELTESRRSDPIAQLDCDDTDQGGKLCTKYAPDVVQCANIDPNESGQMPDWRCEANLPDTVRLGRVQVSCEGFSGPRDPYVLRGSCGLTYRLLPAADSPDQGRIDIGTCSRFPLTYRILTHRRKHHHWSNLFLRLHLHHLGHSAQFPAVHLRTALHPAALRRSSVWRWRRWR